MGTPSPSGDVAGVCVDKKRKKDQARSSVRSELPATHALPTPNQSVQVLEN